MAFGWLSSKIVLYSIGSWLACFVFSCGFFNRDGELQVTVGRFKAYMCGASSLLGAFVLDKVISGVLHSSWEAAPGKSFTGTSLEIGIFFVAVNCVLDWTVLMPVVNGGNQGRPNVEKLTVNSWFHEIGVVYVSIMAQAWLAGRFADHALTLAHPRG